MKAKSAKHLITYQGFSIDPLNLKPEQVSIFDIAHSLSLLCRYGGHSPFHYSVAEHSIRVAQQVYVTTFCIGLTKAALLHDASEAYVQDLISPLKHRLPSYERIEQKIQQVINEVYGIKLLKKEQALIKHFDSSIRMDELEIFASKIPTASPQIAERNFLRLFCFLESAEQHGALPRDVLDVLMANL